MVFLLGKKIRDFLVSYSKTRYYYYIELPFLKIDNLTLFREPSVK